MMTQQHLVSCQRCQAAYRERHYHCCLCGRVFGSASAFEAHQKAHERRGHPATDARLTRLGFFQTPQGVWKRAGTYSKSQYTKPCRGGYSPGDDDAA